MERKVSELCRQYLRGLYWKLNRLHTDLYGMEVCSLACHDTSCILSGVRSEKLWGFSKGVRKEAVQVMDIWLFWETGTWKEDHLMRSSKSQAKDSAMWKAILRNVGEYGPGNLPSFLFYCVGRLRKQCLTCFLLANSLGSCYMRSSNFKATDGVIWKKSDALAQEVNGGDIRVGDLLEVIDKFRSVVTCWHLW